MRLDRRPGNGTRQEGLGMRLESRQESLGMRLESRQEGLGWD